MCCVVMSECYGGYDLVVMKGFDSIVGLGMGGRVVWHGKLLNAMLCTVFCVVRSVGRMGVPEFYMRERGIFVA